MLCFNAASLTILSITNSIPLVDIGSPLLLSNNILVLFLSRSRGLESDKYKSKYFFAYSPKNTILSFEPLPNTLISLLFKFILSKVRFVNSDTRRPDAYSSSTIRRFLIPNGVSKLIESNIFCSSSDCKKLGSFLSFLGFLISLNYKKYLIQLI